MKIFSVNQIREADKFTIEKDKISSVDLMEQAAEACYGWINEKYNFNKNLVVFCGIGNNGGDGLAIAQIAQREGYEVKVIVVNYSDKWSEDFKTNYKNLKSKMDVREIKSVDEIGAVNFNNDKEIVIIDAILGSGINRPVEGLIADCIKFINQQPLEVISIDIPSGLYCDKSNALNDGIIKADYTLSLQFPKLSFMFPENSNYVGEFTIRDIGISEEYILSNQTNYYFTTKEDVRVFLKKRNTNAHKGNFGHALIVAGSKGRMGAAVLTSKACMHSGAGLLTAHVPACGYQIIQIAIPEAMAEVDSEMDFITANIRIEKYNTIGVGPGIGIEKQTQNVVKLLIQNSSVPLVFDADAINILSENKTWLSFIPANSIFTPHIKEFERLVGKVSNTEERLKQQIEFSVKHNAFVVLKGSHTSISTPVGEIYFNSTGNPGMATGGSGDVLTGIITSLLAQEYSPKEACLLGVYLHGLAGDFAALNKTQETMIASDIINHLSDAFIFLKE